MKLSLTALCAALLATTLLNVEAQAVEQPDYKVMQKLVEYGRSKIGQKVNLGQGGECTEFVIQGLEVAGGRPMEHTTITVVRNNKPTQLPTYDWGVRYLALGKKTKPQLQLPKAGCIVQFEECTFSKDGYSWNFPHHTAIVESVNGTMVTLLHQNVDGSLENSQVRRQTVDFSGRTGGRYIIYYPMAK
jgi:hypothetical protein